MSEKPPYCAAERELHLCLNPDFSAKRTAWGAERVVATAAVAVVMVGVVHRQSLQGYTEAVEVSSLVWLILEAAECLGLLHPFAT